MGHHHPRTKTRVITCLGNRADNVCDHHHKQSEIVHLKTKPNGNPTSRINKTLQKWKPNQTTINRDTNRNTDQERPKVPYLLYVKHTSELIQSACRRMGVSVVFKSHGTLCRTLMRVRNARLELPCQGLWVFLRWWYQDELAKALDGAQSSSEKRRQEQWDCSLCLGPWS